MKNKSIIVKNVFSIGAARLLSILFPLLVLPYLINTIGIDQYGIIIFALAFVAYFNTFVDFSFAISAVRSVSKNQNNTKKLNEIASQVISTKLLLLAFACLVGSILISSIPVFNEQSTIFFIVFSSLIGYSLSMEWFFNGLEKMEYTALMIIIFKLLHAASIFFFVKNPEDSWIYATIISSEQLLVALTSMYILHKKFHIRWRFSQIASVKRSLTSNSSLFLNQLLPNLYNNTTTLLLGFFGGPVLTGTYGVIRKIVNLGESVLKIVSKVFFPAINRDHNNIKKFQRTQWIITVITIVLLCGLAPFLPYLIEDLNKEVVGPLILMSISLIGLTLYDIYGLNFFLVRNNDRLVMFNTLLFSIGGFILAFPFIYWLGLIGAALIVSITRISIGSRLMILAKGYKS